MAPWTTDCRLEVLPDCSAFWTAVVMAETSWSLRLSAALVKVVLVLVASMLADAVAVVVCKGLVPATEETSLV